jgi:signal transduction histidine kinase
VTRHDIMNQLSILTSWLHVLREEEMDAEKVKRLDALRDSADIIQGLLVFASEYQDMGAQEPVWADLASAFQKGVQGLPLQEVAVEVDVPPIEVYADPMFERVFRNLVDNSLRHGEGVSRVRLSVRPEGQAQVIVYEDDGSGVPDTLREHVFERGFGKHTGMGLFMVREILGITGMTIRETGEEGSGARFEIIVPEGGSRIQSGKD